MPASILHREKDVLDSLFKITSHKRTFFASFFGCIILLLSGCGNNPDDLLRKYQSAGEPPGPLDQFIASQFGFDLRYWPPYPPMRVCDSKGSCREYDREGVTAYFDSLGEVDYSEAKIERTIISVRSSLRRDPLAQGPAERWLTCFKPKDGSDLYYFLSIGEDFASLHTGSKPEVLVRIVQPTDEEVYSSMQERCGPLAKSTRIIVPPP